jgi:hypothetical protein
MHMLMYCRVAVVGIDNVGHFVQQCAFSRCFCSRHKIKSVSSSLDSGNILFDFDSQILSWRANDNIETQKNTLATK